MEAYPQSIAKYIEIDAKPSFIGFNTSAARGKHLHTYAITITNLSEFTIQLKSRHWLIVDAIGQTKMVKGEGVIGEQPILAPGESFTYSSFCILTGTLGTMQGYYRFIVLADKNSFKVPIPLFELAADGVYN